jgi:hypothetical protein
MADLPPAARPAFGLAGQAIINHEVRSSPEAGRIVLSSVLWFLACAYLFVAALTLALADFRPADDMPTGQPVLFVVALVYAAAWPVRTLRRALRFAGWSS